MAANATTNPPAAAAKPTYAQQLYALAALTAVSTAIGFTMKYSQVAGTFRFSPAAAVVMTELFKLTTSLLIAAKLLHGESVHLQVSLKHSLKKFVDENVSKEVVKHECGLAVAYSIVNIVTYPIFLYTPASVFFLLKAASPVVTAILLRLLVSRAISPVQWFAIAMQCVGLVVTQYNACTGTAVVSALGYFLIFINVAVSCFAGVWNEHIIKNYGTSVNAQNIILYSCGVCINTVLFFVLPPSAVGLDRPYGFFEGFNWSVVAVVVANGSVGLVITAVYKYADVVIKTFGLAGSTVTLFLMERFGILPTSKITTPTTVVVAGSIVVFYAAHLYMAPAKPQPQATKQQDAENGEAGVGKSTADADSSRTDGVLGGLANVALKDTRVTLLGSVGFCAILLALFGQSCEQTGYY